MFGFGKTPIPVAHDDGRIRARFLVKHPGFALDVDLDLPGRGVSALFGHSGSGKTSCLRCFAGLDRPQQGYLHVAGELWQDSERGFFLPAHKRAIGYVFQDANLFPHLSVRKNLEYGQRRIPAAQRKVALDQALQLLGIGHLLERMPSALSGGERQRVGIARALVTSPRLLLMDEPLASLDLKRKHEVLPYLQRLHEELDIPVLYVSHAPDEVARLADHLVLMREGRIELAGPADEVMARPDSPLARLDDASAILHATLVEREAESGLARLRLGADEGSVLWVGGCNEAIGARVRVRVLARDVSVALSRPLDSSILNILPATVVALHDEDAASVMLRLSLVDGSALLARLTRRSVSALGLRPGQAVHAQIKGAALLRP